MILNRPRRASSADDPGYIIPRWHNAKSYFTGSDASKRRKHAVMSSAMRHPGVEYRVRRRHRPTRITCVSSGMMSCDGATSVQTPRSSLSRRTIHRRNRLRRLHALPADGRGKKYRTPADRTSNASARDEKLSSIERISASGLARVATKKRSIEPHRSIIWRISQSRATRSRPRIQRCPTAANRFASRRKSNSRMYAAGDGPMIASTRAID